jgi:hypothetical protein
MRQVATAVKAFQGRTKGKEFQIVSVRTDDMDDDVLEVTVKCVRRATMMAEVAARIVAVRNNNVPITALVFSKSSFERLKQELQDMASVSIGSLTPRHTTYQGYRVLLDPGVSHDDYIEAL